MSRTVEIEDDVYEFLLRSAAEIGESASSIISRLLKISGGASIPQRDASRERSQLERFLEEGEFKALRNATERYLAILSFAYRHYPDRFEEALKLKGSRRIYFARSRGEIEESGKSTYPQPIPASPFWAMTNADTVQKKEILRSALSILEFEPHDVNAASRAIG